MPPRGTSSPMTLKRIHREIADLKKEDLGNMVLEPTGDNMHVWRGVIPGPEGSVYEGGVFNVEIDLPADYPFSAPKVIFKTRIYHMNISDTGSICIDILKTNWSPALSLFKVMLSISSLLTDPNPQDPLVPSVAQQYNRSRKQHDNTAREWTTLYARPKPTFSLTSAPTPAPHSSTSASASTSTPSQSSRQPASSSRGRGTRRAAPNPSARNNTAAGSSRASSHATNPVIVIEDDENAMGSTSNVVNGRGTTTQGKRKRATRGSPVEVLDLVGHEEDENSQVDGDASKKRRTTRSNNNQSNGTDVIVIEDD